MIAEEVCDYVVSDQAQGIVKYYGGGEYAFVALLPNKYVLLSDFVASLDGGSLRSLLTNRQTGEVRIRLPKYEVEYTVDLSDALKNMGMTAAFGGKADFSGITGRRRDLRVDSVVQKTFFSVDENGTRAGAATEAPMYASVKPTFVFTRPFVYMLVDARNYLPLFIGAMNDPTK